MKEDELRYDIEDTAEELFDEQYDFFLEIRISLYGRVAFNVMRCSLLLQLLPKGQNSS